MAKKKDKKKKRYIRSFVLAVLSILFFLSLFNNKMGIIGKLIRKTFFTLSGFTGYFIPLLMLIIAYFIYKDNKNRNKNIIFMIIVFLCFSLVIDIYNLDDLKGFSSRINESLILSEDGLGAGLIGSVLGFIFLKLFGKIGSYLIISLILTISTFQFTEIDLAEILKNIKKTLKIKYKELKKYFKDLRHKKNGKAKDKKLADKKDHVSTDDLVIEDYSEKIEMEVDPATIKNEEVKEAEEVVLINKETGYNYPDINLLNQPIKNEKVDKEDSLKKAKQIEDTMRNFNIEAKVSKVNRGPTITCFELEPAPGVKVSRILNLSDDLALALASPDIRIEAPIPGKAAIGIEVANDIKDSVFLREILEDKKFIEDKNNLPLVLGKDISGDSIISSIDKMPHLLIAGATGSGKSVCINTIITSILYKADPQDVKLILIDPKVVELSVYNGIPHLLLPVVNSPKDAKFALKWSVAEMERRYKLFAEKNVRDVQSYNKKQVEEDGEKLSKIVIIIDELSDLMMVSAQEVEDYICRLAQMARAAGIYLIVATQRPSVDVITGTIKANIPSRISFAVSSQIDSRTILDMAGAEKLLGRGDMLFYPSDYSKPKRIQGAFISDEEVLRLVNYIKESNESNYDEEIIEEIRESVEESKFTAKDELFDQALDLVVDHGEASISMLQRRLKIGYNRSASIVDIMYELGYVGSQEGNKPRKVLISKEDLNNIRQGEV